MGPALSSCSWMIDPNARRWGDLINAVNSQHGRGADYLLSEPPSYLQARSLSTPLQCLGKVTGRECASVASDRLAWPAGHYSTFHSKCVYFVQRNLSCPPSSSKKVGGGVSKRAAASTRPGLQCLIFMQPVCAYRSARMVFICRHREGRRNHESHNSLHWEDFGR